MKRYITPRARQIVLTTESIMVITSNIPIRGEGTDETAPGHGEGGSLDDTRQFESSWDYWN